MYSAKHEIFNFELDVGGITVFLGNLLLSGCCSASRRRMYFSAELDTDDELIVRS